MKQLLTREQAAEILQIEAATLYEWKRLKKGPPYIKVGGAVRYDPDALRAWLDAQTVAN